jgi:hypothetical protein
VDEVTGASCKGMFAEFKCVALLWTDPVDRREVHGLRRENFDIAMIVLQ